MNEENNSRNQEKKELKTGKKNYISAIQKEMEIVSGLVQNNTNIINKLRNFHITLIGALLGLGIWGVYRASGNGIIVEVLKILFVITLFFAVSEGIVTGWQISHINRLFLLDEIVNEKLKLDEEVKKLNLKQDENSKYILGRVFMYKDIYDKNNEEYEISKGKWICETIKAFSFWGYYGIILVSLGLFYLYVEGFTISLYSISFFLIGLVVGCIVCCLIMRKK